MPDVPQAIIDLVEKFERGIHEYKSPDYNETRVRVEFVNPFFKALGWDVTNVKGHASAYRDVIHEDRLKVGEATKAPDYSFRIGGTRKFFVETKKPSKDLKTDPRPAFQLRRYAYSAGLPVSILTDFEEFVVYDCHKKPALKDKPSVARVGYYTYRDYIEKWDEISGVFAKESIQQGAFDKYADGVKGKRGTSEIDKDFLEDLDRWRMALARNFALRNKHLTERELNFAVQMTIDRLIFLRMCEARGVEQYGQLQKLLNGTQTYPRLVEIFQLADDRYNSGLFHFSEEKGESSPPDTVTPDLNLDDKVLKGIIENTYYPACPYEFSILPVEVLGNAYEQFLGKVIRLTPGHRAKVEEKPEVRKAGGVYYTPRYIVDYIVEQTVGRLLAGKTPKQVAALRILDPACGSGSFLLGAYERLLTWHIEWYRAEHERTGQTPTVPPAKGKRKRKSDPPAIFQAGDGEWFLSTAEKKRILLNNIHGVDIDSQAVEVTKLSLLLKVLEDESEETLNIQLKLWRARALPNLSQNIKCGNSLIGSDYFASQLLPDEEEIHRINPFDWRTEFPEAMQAGGFDCVIGNPPYIRIQTMKEWAPVAVEIYKQRYVAASKGNYDIYVVFVERALQLLNDTGRTGFILPHKFFQAKYGQALRSLIASGKHLAEIVHFGDQQVFTGATTYTCLLFLDKAGNRQFRHIKAHDLPAWRSDGSALEGKVKAAKATDREWNFVVGPGAKLFERLSAMPVTLGDVADRIAQGIRTSANEVYVLDIVSDDGALIQAHSRQLDRTVTLERKAASAFLKGREIKPYQILSSGQVVIMPYRIEHGRNVLISEKELNDRFPNTHAYLLENKSYLEGRERGRMKGNNWYGYVYPKNLEVMNSPKILVPDIADRASFALDGQGQYALVSGYGITLGDRTAATPEYVLGLLNSRILDFYLKQVSTTMRGGFFRYFTQFIEQLPIRTIDFDDAEDVARHDKIVALVERMLSLHKKLPVARLPRDKQLYERQIAATDSEIDRLVYELYDLTPEDIRIVEEATSGG
jgi:Eco57I restriction-modification methylase/restriction endonuclease TaqI-like protein/N-6 DNA methylase/type I restriction and modification enzyme subunit R-like protein